MLGLAEPSRPVCSLLYTFTVFVLPLQWSVSMFVQRATAPVLRDRAAGDRREFTSALEFTVLDGYGVSTRQPSLMKGKQYLAHE